MYESAFSYNLTKPYPYKWFTWVVVIGGIVAAALFSVVNIVATGYTSVYVIVLEELLIQDVCLTNNSSLYTTSPNRTEIPDPPPWFLQKPWSFASKVPPKCQDQILLLGSTIYTTHLAYSYQISRIWKKDHDELQQISSLAYHHTPLDNCKVEKLTLTLKPEAFPPAFEKRPRVERKALINCTLYSGNRPHIIELKFMTTDLSSATLIEDIDSHTDSSLWWGSYLWDKLLHHVPTDDHFEVSSNPPGFDPPDQEFLILLNSSDVAYAFAANSSSVVERLLLEQWKLEGRPNELVHTRRSILLAVVQVSLLLTDLGQNSTMNCLGSSDAVWNMVNGTLNLTDLPLISTPDVFIPFENVSLTSIFQRVDTGPPGIVPTFINGLYLCQVPRPKPISTIVMNVIIADLVFLQVLWTTLTWATKTMLERRYRSANCCIICAHDKLSYTHFVKSAQDPPSPTLSINASHDASSESLPAVECIKLSSDEKRLVNASVKPVVEARGETEKCLFDLEKQK